MSQGTRPRRWLRWLLVGLVALGVVVIAADFGIRRYVEERASNEAAQAIQSENLSLKVEGWPFLTQVLGDELDKVRLRAEQVPLSAQGVTLNVSQLDVTAEHLTGVRDLSTAKARHVTVEAIVTWDEVSRAAGLPVSGFDGGRVEAKTKVTIWGAELGIVVSGRPTLIADGTRAILVEPKAKVSGVEIPTDVLETAVRLVSDRFPLPEISGLRVTSLRASADAAIFRLAGSDVPLPR